MRALAIAFAFAFSACPAPCVAQDLTPPESSASAPPPAPAPDPAPDPGPDPGPDPDSGPGPDPGPGSAPTLYLVAPLGGDAPDALAAEAADAVRATLTAEGFGVIDPADTATISPARFTAARRLDDLRPIATELGATGIATVAVWTSDGAASSVIVSIAPGDRSFSATQPVTTTLAEAARDALRAALARQRDALIVGGTTHTHDTEHREVAPPAPHDDGVMRNGQLFGIVGPGFLAAFGAAGIGGGIYASLDETCDQRNPMTGVCLRGERPNYAVGILFIAAGTLALAGAIVWWILGSDAEDVSSGPRIDVVMLPEGGGYVGTRGTF